MLDQVSVMTPDAYHDLAFHYSHRHWVIQGSFGATGAVAPDKLLLAILLAEETT